jgi:GcrA cell cycle regulator
MSGWTEERVATLTKLWADGLSCSLIASQLGGVTRNAVIGKVTRLGLPARTTKTDRRARGTRHHSYGARLRRVFDTVLPPEELKAPDHLGLTFAQLHNNFSQCRYIHGDVKQGNATYCGQPTVEGTSWCACHRSLVWVPPAQRKAKPFIPARGAA